MDGMNHQRMSFELPDGGGRRSFYAMPYERFFIWGATAGHAAQSVPPAALPEGKPKLHAFRWRTKHLIDCFWRSSALS
jgi:hypothetical protein